MEDYPETLQQFETGFSTEEGCREYFFNCGGRMDSGAKEASHHFVSGEVVCDQPEERSQRAGFTACPGAGKLSDHLVVAA